MKYLFRSVGGAVLAALIFSFVSDPSPVAAADVTAPTSVVFDPGPKARCFGVLREGTGIPPATQSDLQDMSGCGSVDDPQRVDDACYGRFPYTGAYGKACPAWDFVTLDWRSEDFQQYPGYDTEVWGNSGSPLTLKMQNNSAQKGDCKLREVAFSYHYVSSSLKRKADYSTYNFSDGRLKVSYDAYASQTGGFACAEKRAILTTDLIYFVNGKKNLISVVHFNPGNFIPPNGDGVIWSNNCADGCRVTVPGQQIPAMTTARVSVDFTELAKKYSAYLGGAIPADSRLEAVQVVNSGTGTDLETRVSNATVTLEP
ncbi:hypothetical protein [Streptomyces niveus]|uniref:Secreted protein n=1 Tax=Streptomyces niveus TaxID=193462 RepID=A0ABZ2A011_STRNV|nr:hypothetical protein [Streptomyces niveus]